MPVMNGYEASTEVFWFSLLLDQETNPVQWSWDCDCSVLSVWWITGEGVGNLSRSSRFYL